MGVAAATSLARDRLLGALMEDIDVCEPIVWGRKENKSGYVRRLLSEDRTRGRELEGETAGEAAREAAREEETVGAVGCVRSRLIKDNASWTAPIWVFKSTDVTFLAMLMS